MAKRQKTNQQNRERVNVYTSKQIIEDNGEHTEEEGDDVEVLEVTRFQRRSRRVRVPTNRFTFDDTLSGEEEERGVKQRSPTKKRRKRKLLRSPRRNARRVGAKERERKMLK